MDNSTVKETWIDKLVDELVDAKDDVSSLESDLASVRADNRELYKAKNKLIDTILDNTRLDYDGKELRIDSDTALIYLLKLEYPVLYRERLEELKRELKELKEIKLQKNKAKAEAAATEEEA